MAKILTFSHIGFFWMILKEPIGRGFVEHIKAYKSLIFKKFYLSPIEGLIPI